MSLKERALKLHEARKGKIEVVSKVPLHSKEDLALAYSPGVAEPCKEIAKNKSLVDLYTSRGNMVAVISDGSAVLGLGNIGPEAALPVMEGKCLLLKEFAGVDAFPIVLNTQNKDEIISIVKAIAPSFGGINLEDIAAPKCVEIEETLSRDLDMPLYQDDQSGTAIVTLAAVINACRLLKKDLSEIKVSMIGVGASGSAIAKILKKSGVKTIYAYNTKGIIDYSKYESYNPMLQRLMESKVIDTIPGFLRENDNVKTLVTGTDIFIGVSDANLLTKEDVKAMNDRPIILAMANPNPEIPYNDAMEAGAFVCGTGRSDFPNQVNNVLAMPGTFKGALECKATKINEQMKLAAARAIAELVSDEELKPDYIVPDAFDKRVVPAVSSAVIEAARNSGVARK